MLFCNKYFKCRFGWNYCNASPLVPGAIECKAVSQMEGPPLRTMERSRPVVNQRSRICLCFSTGRRFSNLGSGQIDSSCLSPSDTGFHGCRPQKRKGPPLPRLPPPAREMPPTSRQLTSETSAGVQPWLIQGIRSGDGVGDLFIYLFIKDIKNNRMRIAQQENSVEKRG